MDIPDLVQQSLDGEEIQAGVSLGDEDAVCLTPTRTLVYKGDGLLSDEQLEEFPHDVEWVAVSEGHRKTKFTLNYYDGTRSFTVPPDRDEAVLELLLEGVLRVESIIDDRESVVDIYRFSELTLIVTEGRLIRLIGAQVWNDDYEVYPFDDVTGLEFERASVATSVVIGIDGRPRRVKVPNDTAPVVRQTVETALFAYYNVASLEELNQVVDDGSDTVATADDDSDIDFGSDFDSLVTDAEHTSADASETHRETGTGADTEPVERTESAGQTASAEPTQEAGSTESVVQTNPDTSPESADRRRADAADAVEPATSEDLSAVADRLEDLTEAVDRQNELLTRQHRAIKQLVDDLQSE